MNKTNYSFFEEFKRLEKLCNDIYSSHNGVTRYIDDMKEVPYSKSHNIPDWESDMKNLIRLRHIRNIMAHNEGAFDENMCTDKDIAWLQNFYKRILKQTDPIALLYKKYKYNAPAPNIKPKSSGKNHGTTFMIIVLIIAIVITLIILLFL